MNHLSCKLSPGRSEAARRLRRGTLDFTTGWALVQLAVLVLGVGYGAHRYRAGQHEHLPPVPQRDPVRMTPRYDRPEIVSDEQLSRVLARLQPTFRGPQPKINFVDHALRFWGVPATFSDPEALSGGELRELLVDHRAFRKAWGPQTKPFLVPDTRGAEMLAFRTHAGNATASHVDHTLAGLAEVGTPLDFPLTTPRGEMTLQAGFDQALRQFSLNQEEYEWSTMVFLHYLPHVKSWYSTEGQLITWDLLAERLTRQRLAQGVCLGQHRLYALALMLRVDEQNHLLTAAGRERVVGYLQDATRRLTATQYAEGYWDARWPGEEWDGSPTDVPNPLGESANRILATGHILEWWAFAPPDVLPSDDVLVRAGQWLVRELDGLSESQVRQFYPFLTHAGRALSLWRNKQPHEVPLNVPEWSLPTDALSVLRGE